jgi:hypothetical protein
MASQTEHKAVERSLRGVMSEFRYDDPVCAIKLQSIFIKRTLIRGILHGGYGFHVANSLLLPLRYRSVENLIPGEFAVCI